MRVIVTGSRDWPEPGRVYAALEAVYREATQKRQRLVVVHGACPTGADAHAHEWVLMARFDGMAVDEEMFPAHWREGPAAGPHRNARMVAAGADRVLAFHKDNSRGTASTIRYAREAGIHVDIQA
ncbi:SLOG family protein [Nonomuraea sp. NPDC023979]|uniref:SLOG family protein n=1 Tax=Nonomuraea sp. NPDC023979 TaxID=3154796 RepID=UPI0033CE2B90